VLAEKYTALKGGTKGIVEGLKSVQKLLKGKLESNEE
jgi:hypothetical protein